MPTEKAFTGKLDQKETNYVPLSAVAGSACANCRWFKVWDNEPECHLVSGYPEPILATGMCDRHELSTPREPDLSNPLPVVIIEPPMMEDDSAEMALPTTRRSLKALILDIFKGTPKPQQAFTVTKAQDGNYYWLARHTGKFIDREQEIITDKAHEEYVARVQKGLVPMPELWTWHKQGTMHGQADAVWKTGGFVHAFGHFVGTEEQIERAVNYYQKMGDKIKLSHMFKYPKQAKRGKVYHAYNTVEITTLPDGAEAFPYTSYEVQSNMAFTKEVEDMIRGIGGDDMVKRAQALDTKALPDTQALEAAGVISKGLENFEGSTLPTDDGYEALKQAQIDIDTRLKAVEQIPALVAGLQASLKTLADQLALAQKTYSDALKVSNDTALKLAEYQAVEPPASQSKDTLLNEREKSLIEQISESVKQDGSKSLIDLMVGTAPVVSGN